MLERSKHISVKLRGLIILKTIPLFSQRSYISFFNMVWMDLTIKTVIIEHFFLSGGPWFLVTHKIILLYILVMFDPFFLVFTAHWSYFPLNIPVDP